MTAAEKQEETEQVPVAKAKSTFFDLIAKVETKGGEVIFTRHGKPVAKLVPIGEPRRKIVEFGCLKDLVKAAPVDAFNVDAEAWGELHDEEGKPYGRP